MWLSSGPAALGAVLPQAVLSCASQRNVLENPRHHIIRAQTAGGDRGSRLAERASSRQHGTTSWSHSIFFSPPTSSYISFRLQSGKSSGMVGPKPANLTAKVISRAADDPRSSPPGLLVADQQGQVAQQGYAARTGTAGIILMPLSPVLSQPSGVPGATSSTSLGAAPDFSTTKQMPPECSHHPSDVTISVPIPWEPTNSPIAGAPVSHPCTYHARIVMLAELAAL
ncbi:hypothetical protein F5X68DRAFT_13405 [Plectosphaerella plurivora]|uniref:Uncharacterized protein n=1 Tax=Plectosphaerella plurivora TaxID=936078 RepID=A0A9P8VBN4_9PEZI|nr:hypothetical protein F5X68DRAFT_13405 [Plectosphaerella plurivora]